MPDVRNFKGTDRHCCLCITSERLKQLSLLFGTELYGAAHLIGEVRRRSTRSREHKFAVLRGIGEVLAGALAAGLLEFHGATGDDRLLEARQGSKGRSHLDGYKRPGSAERNADRLLVRRLAGQVSAIKTTSAGEEQKRKGTLAVRIVGPVPRIVRSFTEVTTLRPKLGRHPSMLLLIRDVEPAGIPSLLLADDFRRAPDLPSEPSCVLRIRNVP